MVISKKREQVSFKIGAERGNSQIDEGSIVAVHKA